MEINNKRKKATHALINEKEVFYPELIKAVSG
jgi:hypothetical protein